MVSLPTLVYVYHPDSFSPLSILEAADGVCNLVWVVNSEHPAVAVYSRLLRKSGPVVDAAGRSVSDVAAELAGHSLDGVLSMHDGDLVWTARLADILSLCFHSIDTALKLTDKHAQRTALRAAGLAVPAFELIEAGVDIATAVRQLEGFPFPAVLKPRHGQASRDTFHIERLEEFVGVLAELRSRPDRQPEEYVLEEYVPDASEPLGGEGFAPFVSVESVVERGRVVHAGVSGRTPFLWPFRETGYFTPSALAPDIEAEALRVAGEAALALGVVQACLHTEIKLTDAGPVVIEVNGRPGGGMSEMLERASGFSILRTALRLAVGEDVRLTSAVECECVGYLLYVFPADGVGWIDAVEGLDDLRNVEGVDEIVLVRGPGQRIDWWEGSEAHVFHFVGTVHDHHELRNVTRAVDSLVKIDGHPAS
jgi:ATP-grasp domain